MRLNAQGLVSNAIETVEVTSLACDLGQPALAIIFKAFNDGRGFTLATRLRKAGYRGRLVAEGHLIPDQFAYALSCGFDELEVSEKIPVAQWVDQLARRGVSYQTGTYGQNILSARHLLLESHG
jgi:uncharacterized protein (DUF934 family)